MVILFGDDYAATAPRNGVSVVNVGKLLNALRSDGLRYLWIERCSRSLIFATDHLVSNQLTQLVTRSPPRSPLLSSFS